MVFDRFTRQVRDDLQARFPRQRKTQRDKLAVLVATMLQVKSANLMELGSGLPIKTTDALSRFQWIKRFLGNDLVDIDAVMGPFSREALALASAEGAQPVLIIDQSTITQLERHELVMVALRVGKRAIPIAWRVYKARGSLGWREQSEVLEVARSFLPEGCKPLLMGDRFYGNSDIISWCQMHGWDYCLRLKGSMFLAQEPDAPQAQDRKLSALWAAGQHRFEGAYLTRRRVRTNIQMLQDEKAEEPWFIAMSDTPSLATARTYAKRWGIEAMFSDFKSRGFGLTESQLRSPGKLNRLIMVMAIALYWAVSTGLWIVKQRDSQKNQEKSVVGQWFRHSRQD